MTRTTSGALATVKPKEFNEVTVRCVGSHVQVKVNGVAAVEEDREKLPSSGVIAWQLGAGTEEIRFKNIRFTDLSEAKKP